MKRVFAVAMLLSAMGWGQGACKKDIVMAPNAARLLQPVSANVRVCSDSLSPCTTVTVYSDATLGTPIPNPIATDLNGNYGYCVASGTYNEQISGATIVGVNNTPVTLVGASQWNNVTNFGAKGDGTTDDTAAIQTAFTPFCSGTKAGTVYFPPLKYRVAGTITCAKMTNVFISGFGATLVGTSNSGPIMSLGTLISSAHDQSIQDLQIAGLKVTTNSWVNGAYVNGQSSQDAIQINDVDRCNIDITGENVGGAIVNATGYIANSAPIEWCHMKIRGFDVGTGLQIYYSTTNDANIVIRRAHNNCANLQNAGQLNLSATCDETLTPNSGTECIVNGGTQSCPSAAANDGVGILGIDVNWSKFSASNGLAKKEAMRLLGNVQWNVFDGIYYNSGTLTNNTYPNISLNNNGGASTPQHNIFGSIYAGWDATGSSNKPTVGINQIAGSFNSITALDSTGTLSGNGNLPVGAAGNSVRHACDITTTSGGADSCTVTGMTVTGICNPIPTNGTASAITPGNVSTTVSSNTVTLNISPAVASATFAMLCSLQ